MTPYSLSHLTTAGWVSLIVPLGFMVAYLVWAICRAGAMAERRMEAERDRREVMASVKLTSPVPSDWTRAEAHEPRPN